jgi:3-phenylpropionate/trans-cinnamate dioxygenase ferredoxin reductase subunit
MTKPFIVIGGGQACGQALQTFRREGYDGPLLAIAAERELPYERPPLSKEILLGDKDATFARMKDASFYEGKGIELELGRRATALDARDKRLTLDDGRTIDFEKLLICTGARVRRLDIPGSDLAGVHYLRTLEDALAIREALGRASAVAIVGAGYVGLEVAAAATAKGLPTTILEAGPEVLCRVVPTEVGAIVRGFHERRGATVHLQSAVVKLLGDSSVRAVETADGRRFEADLVVIGVGIVPEVELASGAGLEVDDGIVVDGFTRTSAPDIHAAGDVTKHPNATLGRAVRLESWQNAQNQAICAARSMLGKLAQPYDGIPWFWSDQASLNIQLLGAPAGWDEVVVLGEIESPKATAIYLDGERIAGAACLNRPDDVALVRKLMRKKAPVSRARLKETSLEELAKS